MKIIKSLKAAAFSLVFGTSLAVSAVSVSAQSVSDSEMKQVNESLAQYNEFLTESKMYGEMPELEEIDFNINSSEKNVYKSYNIDNYIVNIYNEVGNFDAVISDEYKIFAESGNQLVTIVNKNGKLTAVGSEILNEGEEFINFEKEAERIEKQSDKEILDLKFAKSNALYLDLIYYRTADGEFVVPYFDCSYDGVSEVIENGKVYSADEFVGRLSCIIDTSNSSKPGEYGGGPFRAEPLAYSADKSVSENSSMSYAFYTVIAASGLAVLALAVYFSVKVLRKKSR